MGTTTVVKPPSSERRHIDDPGRRHWECAWRNAGWTETGADSTTIRSVSSSSTNGWPDSSAAAHCATNSYTLIHARHHDLGCGSYRALYPFRFLIKNDPGHPHTASAGVKNMWEEAP